MSFDDLVDAGSMTAAKAVGKVRMEGKDYVMADGDVVEFRFNSEPATFRSPVLSRLAHLPDQEAASSSFLRRSQVVTSVLHLLALHEPQAGTTLDSV